MEKCPTCNAKYKSGPICNRCKSDLSFLLKLEKKAHDHLITAKQMIAQKKYESAELEIKQSMALKKSKKSKNLNLYLKILKGDFQSVINNLLEY